MLACQRSLFALDPGVAYLNAASISPLPRAVRLAGTAGVDAKGRPWRLDPADEDQRVEDTRRAAAALIGATADDIAIVGAVSYGIATVCANTTMPKGARILILEGEHTSLALSWTAYAQDVDAVVDVVRKPADGDWTAAVLEAIARPGAPPVGIAALTPLFWSDGALVDLASIAVVLREHGVPLLIDATQAAGIMALDVAKLRPDFLVFPSYKWILGPYGLAFLYVAPHRQSVRPLEYHVGNRESDGATYLAGARRFDRGERDRFITIPMALAGLRIIEDCGVALISDRLRGLTDRLVAAIADLPVRVAPRTMRAPHILGLRFPTPPRQAMVDHMAADGLIAGIRGDALRISPHVYNDEADMDRCAAWLRDNLAAYEA